MFFQIPYYSTYAYGYYLDDKDNSEFFQNSQGCYFYSMSNIIVGVCFHKFLQHHLIMIILQVTVRVVLHKFLQHPRLLRRDVLLDVPQRRVPPHLRPLPSIRIISMHKQGNVE